MPKKNEIKMNVTWVECPENQREAAAQAMLDFLISACCPDIQRLRDAVEESKRAIAEADRLLSTPLVSDPKVDARKARIAALEAELEQLKRQG